MILELCTNRKTNEKQQLSQKVKCKNITICKYANVSETFPQCYSSITTKRNHLPKNPLPFILGLHGKPVQFHQSLSGCLACWRSGRKPSEWVWGGGQARWQAGGVVSGGGGVRGEMRSFYNYITNNEEERRTNKNFKEEWDPWRNLFLS